MIMNKYLRQNALLKEKRIGSRASNTDDMIDKQFYLVSSTITIDVDNSVMTVPFIEGDPFAFPDPIADIPFVDGTKFETEEIYQLFLKDYDATNFFATLRLVINAAKADGICILINSSLVNISVERQEQGFLIDIIFNIKDL